MVVCENNPWKRHHSEMHWFEDSPKNQTYQRTSSRYHGIAALQFTSMRYFPPPVSALFKDSYHVNFGRGNTTAQELPLSLLSFFNARASEEPKSRKVEAGRVSNNYYCEALLSMVGGGSSEAGIRFRSINRLVGIIRNNCNLDLNSIPSWFLLRLPVDVNLI